MTASFSIIGVRIGAIVASLSLWFWTQRLLARRDAANFDPSVFIPDGIHGATAH